MQPQQLLKLSEEYGIQWGEKAPFSCGGSLSAEMPLGQFGGIKHVGRILAEMTRDIPKVSRTYDDGKSQFSFLGYFKLQGFELYGHKNDIDLHIGSAKPLFSEEPDPLDSDGLIKALCVIFSRAPSGLKKIVPKPPNDNEDKKNNNSKSELTVPMKRSSQAAPPPRSVLINAKLIQAIREDVNCALEVIAKKHGLKSITMTKAKYEQDGSAFTAEMEAVAVIVQNGVQVDDSKVVWDRDCRRYGLSPDDYGRVIRLSGFSDNSLLNGSDAKFSGIDKKRKLYPIQITVVESGKTHLIKKETALKLLRA